MLMLYKNEFIYFLLDRPIYKIQTNKNCEYEYYFLPQFGANLAITLNFMTCYQYHITYYPRSHKFQVISKFLTQFQRCMGNYLRCNLKSFVRFLIRNLCALFPKRSFHHFSPKLKRRHITLTVALLSSMLTID